MPSTTSLDWTKTWMPAAISAFTRVFDALCAGMTKESMIRFNWDTL
jgi:hypothetical protein